VKLKKADMTTLTRSATLPYATAEAATLTATARRLLLDPVDVGPIRLLGVGLSGLSDVRQESLFPELETQEAELSETRVPVPPPEPEAGGWRVGDDVAHPEFGHGWIQGAGHGVMTVRFESRSTGPGPAFTLPVDTPDVVAANPVESLDWGDYLGRLSPESADDVGDG
jgi:DNA polymerase-4